MYLYFNFTPVKIMLSTIKNKKGSVQRMKNSEKFRFELLQSRESA